MVWKPGQVVHGSGEGMAPGPGTGNTNVAKRVDPEHLSYMGKLVE